MSVLKIEAERKMAYYNFIKMSINFSVNTLNVENRYDLSSVI